MTTLDQLKIKSILKQCRFFLNNLQQDQTFLQKAHKCLNIIKQMIDIDTRSNIQQLPNDTLVTFSEICIDARSKDQQAKRYLDYFFERNDGENQYYIRALFAYATIEARLIQRQNIMAEQRVELTKRAFSYIEKAIAIIIRPENKQKYQFLLYNASTTTWHIIRPLFLNNWAKSVAQISQRLSNLLEESDDSDFNWRCRYLTVLYQTLLDADKKPQALKILDKLWDATKKKGDCDFQESLFRLRLHAYRDNAGQVAGLKKESETGDDSKRQWKPLHTLQAIKSGAIPEAQIQKELQTAIISISPEAVNPEQALKAGGSKISHILQDRLAEAGRIAIQNNFIQMAEGCVAVISKVRTSSLRGKIWTEYTKAQLLLKRKSSQTHPKTGMRLNQVQKQIQAYQRRIQALKILQRTGVANKRLNDANIIAQGCSLIWNISLPLLRESSRLAAYKPLLSAANMLEMIGSSDTNLRVALHLQLAKCEMAQDFLSKAEKQAKKALKLDYSIARAKLPPGDVDEAAVNQGKEDVSQMQRQYDKYLKFVLQKLELRQNIYGTPQSVMEQLILDVQNALNAKNPKMRQTLLQKSISTLQNYKDPQFDIDPSKNQVQEEIKQNEHSYNLKMTRERKNRVLIATQIAKLCYQDGLIDMAIDSAFFALKNQGDPDQWKPKKEAELIVAYSQAHFVLAESYADQLLEEEIQVAYNELTPIQNLQEDEMDESRQYSPQLKTKLDTWKLGFVKNIQLGVKAAVAVNQSWLTFNGAIILWNNYLPLFKKSNFTQLIFEQALPSIQECFQGMNTSLANYDYPGPQDYFQDRKLAVFTNLGMVLARLHQKNGKNDQALRVCEIQLQKQLPSSLKKSFDTIKARITKSAAGAGAAKPAAGGGAKGGKGGAAGAGAAAAADPQALNDAIASEVVGMIELIINTKQQNPATELVKKAVDQLKTWKPNALQQADLQMHAELWAKLGRLACNINSNLMLKMSLVCAQTSFKGVPLSPEQKAKPKDKGRNWARQVPSTRLRWYSVAQALYGQVLSKLVNQERQQKDSQQKLLFSSVSHFIEAGKLATQAGLGWLLLECTKSMWNAVLPLLDTEYNRRKLIQPLASIGGYLRIMRENSDPDFLLLLYSALFACITEHKQWKLGEQVVNQAFEFVPQTHQRPLWEAKMLYYSKLGKNVLNAIANMKESNASLQAKVWVKLARSAADKMDQFNAYQKAIQILRKEGSVEAADVMIQFGQWLNRKGYPTNDAQDQLEAAVDIMLEIQPGWQEEEQDQEDIGDYRTKKSSQSRSSKSKSKSRKSKQSSKSKQSKSAKSKAKTGKSSRSKRSKRQLSSKTGQSHRSKKTKTKLSMLQQEQEGQPEYLNCTHFDRLFRVHTMLAMLAPDSFKQKQYLMDAFSFLIRIWKQSFLASAAFDFAEAHRQQFIQSPANINLKDPQARSQFLAQLFLTPELAEQVSSTAPPLPKTPEQWVNFTFNQQQLDQHFNDKQKNFFKSLGTRIVNAEERTILCLVAIPKPELTYQYMQKMLQMFESHYLHQEMIPLLKTMEIFAQKILKNQGLARLNTMKMARLLMNLGMKEESQMTTQQAGEFVLTEQERKVSFEKIKGLADPNDDLNSQVRWQHFIRNDSDENQDQQPPLALGPIRSHQLWLMESQQMLKWGKVSEAQILATESALHARVLKQKKLYAKALHILAQIEFLKGDSNQALRYNMQSQGLANNLKLLQSSILQTNQHLIAVDRPDDAEMLLTRSLDMFQGQLQRKNQGFNNLDLVFVVESLLLETCLHYQQQSIAPGRTFNQSCRFIQAAFELQNRFNRLSEKYGYQQRHLIKLLEFAQSLYQAACSEGVLSANLFAIEFLQKKMEKCGLILIETQKMLNEQFYFLGLSLQRLESSPRQSGAISLPLCRLLGLVKVRLAQINSTIGVSKTRLKELSKITKHQKYQTLGSTNFSRLQKKNPKSASQKEQLMLQKDSQADSQLAQKLERAHAGWMEHISRQIDAISQRSAKHFNRYEKSISFIQSAINLLHPQSVEYLQAMIELCRSKRLLAENKKHLRGVWQYNAKEIDRYHRKMLKMLKQSTQKQEEVRQEVKKYSQIYADGSDPISPKPQGQDLQEQDLDATQVNWEQELSEEDKIQYTDATLDYKSEAIRQFLSFTKWNGSSSLDLLNLNYKGSTKITPSSGSAVTSTTQSLNPSPQPNDAQQVNLASSGKNSIIPSPLAVFSLEFAQARGNVSPEQAFYYLSLYQFIQSRDFLHNIYSTALGPQHDDNLVLRTLKHIESSFSYFTASPIMPEKTFTAKKKEMEANSQAWKVLTQNYSLKEVKERLPLQSAYLLIQMSPDRQFLYVGYVHAKKLNEDQPPPLNNQQLGQVREMEYQNIERIQLTPQSLGTIANVQARINALKHSMLKTPATSEEDLEQLMNQGNQEYDEIVRECETLFGPILERLNDVINPELEVPESADTAEEEKEKQAAAAKDAKGGGKKDDKKAPAKDAKKGAAGGAAAELAKYEANLPLSNSGIQSLVILLDWRISDLPIESMYPFQKIPVVTRDFSLHHFIQRVKRAGHVTNVHNNQGISKEALKYIIDIPSTSNLTKSGRELSSKLHEIVEKLKPALLGSSANWEGVLTDTHIPSLGQWQRKIFSSQLFTYWGLNCILHLFPPTQIAHLSAFSGCKAMLLFDRINAQKALVDRNSLLSVHYQLSEQPLQIAALLTLIGVNYIGLNQFAVKTEETINQYECILKESIKADGGIYLGAGLNKYRDPIPIYEEKKKPVEQEQNIEQQKKEEAKKGGKKPSVGGAKGAKKDESNKNLPQLQEEPVGEIIGYKERPIMYKGNAQQYGFGLMRVV